MSAIYSKVYLIGYMASGKTTIGSMLADRLGYTFYDTDHLISAWKGKSIEQIFSNEGEPSFRQFENEMIRFISELDKVIVSTGGGLPIYHQNLSLMKKTGKVMYLKTEVNTLITRIKNDTQIRPLHPSNQSEDDMKRAINERLAKREAYYLQADHVIDTSNDLETILQEILCHLH